MEATQLCPICGVGRASAQVEQVDYEYKGIKSVLPLHYNRCDTCGSEFAGLSESAMNKQATVAFRKAVDGLPVEP